MKIRQLSVFLENRPGRLSTICRTLSDAGVNLSSLTLAESGEFGLLRLLTPDVDKALAALQAANYAVKATEVIALQVPDRPGGLALVLDALEKGGVSISYMYAFATKCDSNAVMIFRFADTDAALAVLKQAGFSVCEQVRLFGC